MSAEIPVAGNAGSVPQVEPVRVLVPSHLGSLGVEFVHTAITRIVIGPAGREKRLFFPLSDYEESEFLDEVFGRLSEYLAGARRNLELEYDLGPSGLDGFARRVLKETSRTPYGRTRTYKEIADSSGRPDAYRQVMAILEKNPLPLIIPCHRILPSKQGLGGYVGGAARKRWLLRMERDSAAQFSGEITPPRG
jgi:methylated-DNA-[protein]-cysteine S-methyltransferase